ncbi:hypothetical protein SLS60_003104 [Paraconiothyrium brasiliense]|uniref:Uncharacterized protein n=1 Tax=Paraconiothyrium brasiliense TaxID=300254 RepID=A0ABR3RUR0_9PLEO
MWLGGILIRADLTFGKLLAFAVGLLCVGEIFSKAGLTCRKIIAILRNVVAISAISLIRLFIGSLSDRDSVLDSMVAGCTLLLAGILFGVIGGMYFKHSLVVRNSIPVENMFVAGVVLASFMLLKYNKKQHRLVARREKKLRKKGRTDAARIASTDTTATAPDNSNGDIDNVDHAAAQENSVADKPAIKPPRASAHPLDA